MVEHIKSKEDFEEKVLKSDTPVVVDFWAEWCGPCKMLGPVFEELSGEYEGKAAFVKVSVEEVSELAEEYGVRGIPCIIVFSKGKEVDRWTGAMDKEGLKEKVDAALQKA